VGRLVKLQDIDQFSDVVIVPEDAVTPRIPSSVRERDEPGELAPMLREILADPTETPHGPTEIADVLISKVRLRGERCIAAFVLKGKSFSKVRASDIDHQVVRLRQIPDLGLMTLVAVGHIQDGAQRDFRQRLRLLYRRGHRLRAALASLREDLANRWAPLRPRHARRWTPARRGRRARGQGSRGYPVRDC